LVCDGFVNNEVWLATENGCDELGIGAIGRERINAFEVPIQLSASK
jgi:hypothetical protein